MSCKRIHVFYSGRVQGVGFRYTARSIASGLNLKGWVKNSMDGRVELVCEGEEDRLKRFLDNIKSEFLGHYITDVDVRWEGSRHEFNRFDIRF